MGTDSRTFQDFLNDIEVEDLQYIETDLCYYQQVNETHIHTILIFKRLLICPRTTPSLFKYRSLWPFFYMAPKALTVILFYKN